MENTERTSTGLDANVAASLSYGLGWVTGLVFLAMERDNRFVRFHAMQSTIVFATISLVFVLLQSIPLLGMLLSLFIVMPVSAVIWLLMMFKAYQGERFKLPIAGDMAEQRI
jgi:uncharacterized membrane protein